MNRIRPVLFGVLLFSWACSGTQSVTKQNTSKQKTPEYTLIYVIHGDSDYLYHEDGKALQADEEVLAEAIQVASEALSGEVLIFHQKPEKKRVLFFPGKDRVFYHYRKGELISTIDYSPVNGGLIRENQLIEQHMTKETHRKALFYFGHEIPLARNYPYHSSDPESNFNLSVFTEDLHQLPIHFDVLTLSTCNNGHPRVIAELADKAEAIVASPQNLHLSHLSSEKILLLEEQPDIYPFELAQAIARDSFAELSAFVTTEIAISVYYPPMISDYLNMLLSNNAVQTPIYPSNEDNIDCKEVIPALTHLNMAGIKTYYQPPMFGINSGKSSHSGWGCKP